MCCLNPVFSATTASVNQHRRKQKPFRTHGFLALQTFLPTNSKKIPNIQPTVPKILFKFPSKTWLDILSCARMVVSAAALLKTKCCSQWWFVQWCRGFEQRIFSSYMSAIVQGRTNRIAKAEEMLNLAQCSPNMYHLTHSVLANTLGYRANSPSKKFHPINHTLPSHSRPQDFYQ